MISSYCDRRWNEMTKEIEKNGTSWNSFVFSVALQVTFLRNYLLKCSCDDCNASIHAWDLRIPFTFSISKDVRLTTVYFPLVHWKFTRKENKPFQRFNKMTKKSGGWDTAKTKNNIPTEPRWECVKYLIFSTCLLIMIAEKSCKIFSSAFETCKRQHVVNLRLVNKILELNENASSWSSQFTMLTNHSTHHNFAWILLRSISSSMACWNVFMTLIELKISLRLLMR